MRPISRTERNPQMSLPISNSSQNELMDRDESYDKESSSEEAFEFLVEPRGFDRWSITKNNREASLKETTQHRKKQKQYGTDEGDSDSSYLSQGSEIAIDMLAHWDLKRTRKKEQNPLHQSHLESLSIHRSSSPEGKLLHEYDIARLKNSSMLSRPTIRSKVEVQDMVNLIKPCVPVSSASGMVMNHDSVNSYSRAKVHLQKAENDELFQFTPTEVFETHV